jgi:hypothetical protein
VDVSEDVVTAHVSSVSPDRRSSSSASL